MDKSYLLIALVGLAILASGCAETNNDQETPEPEEPQQDNPEETDTDTVDKTVEIRGYSNISYNKKQINVEQGETVKFIYINEGGTHDLRLELDRQDVANTQVLSGSGAQDSFTYTFQEDGNYQFYCSVGGHRAQGMEGTIQLN